MVQLGITTLSSKGQIVIPNNMRKGFKTGEKLVIIRDGDYIIIQKATTVSEKIKISKNKLDKLFKENEDKIVSYLREN